MRLSVQACSCSLRCRTLGVPPKLAKARLRCISLSPTSTTLDSVYHLRQNKKKSLKEDGLLRSRHKLLGSLPATPHGGDHIAIVFHYVSQSKAKVWISSSSFHYLSICRMIAESPPSMATVINPIACMYSLRTMNPLSVSTFPSRKR